MPKRTAEDKLDHYRKKIKRLQKRKFRRIRALSSSSDSQPESNVTIEEIALSPDATLATDVAMTAAPDVAATLVPDTAAAPVPDIAASLVPPELDPNILAALGDIVDDQPEFGEKIHENLAKIWTTLLKKGMSREIREVFLKNYLIPENCTLLQAPSLNPEISMAIPDSGKFRDKKMAASQQQLGAGITAISRGLNLLLSNDDKIDSIKYISDGCRILADLHYQSTESRIKFIIPSLDKSFLQFVGTASERDNTLFGSNLSDKIKSSQTITKQGQQIKKVSAAPRPSTSSLPPTTARTSYQGNGGGPSRYQSNRGARGGYKRTSQRAPPASNTSSAQQRPSTRPRAPPRR